MASDVGKGSEWMRKPSLNTWYEWKDERGYQTDGVWLSYKKLRKSPSDLRRAARPKRRENSEKIPSIRLKQGLDVD